jgi:transposase
MAGITKRIWRFSGDTHPFQSLVKKRDMGTNIQGVSGRGGCFDKLSTSNEYAMIDATIVRAHQHSAGAMDSRVEEEAIGRSAGGPSTKIHAVVDALGNPTLFLTPGQSSDLEGADQLLPQVETKIVIADKGYDADDRVRKPLARYSKCDSIEEKSSISS